MGSATARSAPEQALRLPALVLRFVPILLALLAGYCWFTATTSKLILPLSPGVNTALHWWSPPLMALGVALVFVFWIAGTLTPVRAGLVIAVAAIGLSVAAAMFWKVLVPRPAPIRPLGPAVPYALAGFALALLGCIVIAFASAATGSSRHLSPAVGSSSGGRARTALALVLAIVLVAAVAVAASRLGGAYLLNVNEYRTIGDTREPGVGRPSTLTGQDRWRLDLPGLAAAQPAVTNYGLALVTGDSVTLIDHINGRVRWRYQRSDSVGSPAVASTDGGRYVVVSWEPTTAFILDARTGQRVRRWTGHGIIRLADPPLVEQVSPGGTHKIIRLGPRGDERWSYPLDRCQTGNAYPAGDGVLLALSAGCGGQQTKLVDVDADTGRPRWTLGQSFDKVAAVTSDDALVETHSDTSTTIDAVNLVDGHIHSTRTIDFPGGRRRLCENMILAAAQRVVFVACERDAGSISAPHFVAVVQGYRLSSDAPILQETYDRAIVWSLAVTSDARAVVTHDDIDRGCLLTQLTPDGKGPELVIGRDIHSCSDLVALAVGPEVLLLDYNHGRLRALG